MSYNSLNKPKNNKTSLNPPPKKNNKIPSQQMNKKDPVKNLI